MLIRQLQVPVRVAHALARVPLWATEDRGEVVGAVLHDRVVVEGVEERAEHRVVANARRQNRHGAVDAVVSAQALVEPHACALLPAVG